MIQLFVGSWVFAQFRTQDGQAGESPDCVYTGRVSAIPKNIPSCLWQLARRTAALLACFGYNAFYYNTYVFIKCVPRASSTKKPIKLIKIRFYFANY